MAPAGILVQSHALFGCSGPALPGRLDVQLGYVSGRPPQESAFAHALDGEVERMTGFLALEGGSLACVSVFASAQRIAKQQSPSSLLFRLDRYCTKPPMPAAQKTSLCLVTHWAGCSQADDWQ